MKKIYCKNCIWYRQRETHINQREIGDRIYSDRQVHHQCLFDDPIGGGTGLTIIQADLRNKDNNCPYYKPKWWRRLLRI